MSVNEDLGMMASIDRVSHEESAEEQYFGYEKQPHSEFASVKLLLSRFEVMRNMCVMGMARGLFNSEVG